MKVLIVRNQSNPAASDATFSLSAYLTDQGYQVDAIKADQISDISSRLDLRKSLEGSYDLTVVLGGDGTIIRTASLLHDQDAPILGINFGHLGFLANDSEEGVVSLVSRALAGDLHSSRRSCLDVIVEQEGIQEEQRFFAVNEACISRGAAGRTLGYRFGISDVPMARLRGDGLIVATATGSTAYSLAAGGPLVTPGFTGMVVQPLAPHTLTARTVLADANDVVDIAFDRPEDRMAATLFIDGDAAPVEGPIASVRVQRSLDAITFLYVHADHFLTYSASMFFGV